jgi:hypothetical protein
LLGSSYFIKNPPIPKETIKAMFNFDMIGRLDSTTNKITIYGTGTSIEAEELLNNRRKSSGLEFAFAPDGYGPSDHAPFYAENIPVLFITSGVHQDYHTPEDNIERINYQGEKIIADFAFGLIKEIAELSKNLTFKEAGPKLAASHGRKYKVTLGIMPDFTATDNAGLGVGGVREEGPAAKGGMKKGDLIQAINGMKVINIYDYMARLNKLEPGQTIIVDVLRDGNNIVLLIQL